MRGRLLASTVVCVAAWPEVSLSSQGPRGEAIVELTGSPPSRVGDPCDESFFEGCGCRTTDGGAGGTFLGIIVVLLLRRRKEAV
jgi:MYXO-CTERM domain-containing protein